jgi:glycosyltransferase involved in cell wall biosynthesis
MPERTLLAGQVFVPKCRDGPLRLLCLGRIAPIKGIEQGLRILANVQSEVHLTIAGAIEDPEYEIELRRLEAHLPGNVAVEWLGPVPADRVPALIRAHDALFSPTRGENFGHSIAESLALGRPVIITPQTPWSFAESSGSVIHIDTAQVRESARLVDDFARMSPAQILSRQERAYFVGRNGLEGGVTLRQLVSGVTDSAAEDA